MPDLSRRVHVLHDGAWYHGWLEAVRHEPDGWQGFVRYSTDTGMTYLQWRPEAELRKA